MDKIFDGAIHQRIVEVAGTYSDSSFVAEFSPGNDEGHRRGYLYAYAQIEGLSAEVSRIALISGRTLAFSPPTQFGPISLRVQILDTEPLPQSLTVWKIEGAQSAPPLDEADCVLRGSLIEFDAVPSSEGVAVGPGLAVFTAGESTFQLPNPQNPDYTQSYRVDGDKFWGVGARSRDRYQSGAFSFVSGTGRSMLGLVAVFPEIDFQLLDWAWYVHSPSQVYCFEREPGKSIRSVEGHPWSPDQKLSLVIANQKIQYGIGGEIVYESPIPVENPLYFAAVLGPQAFVINCLRSKE